MVLETHVGTPLMKSLNQRMLADPSLWRGKWQMGHRERGLVTL